MKKAMRTLQDLVEEAKIRTVWWALCIFCINYFLSHTSKSMWVNLPVSILLLCAPRFLSRQMEFRWRVRPVQRLSNMPSSLKRKRRIDSPVVEAAVNEFINKIIQDFVVDLWYSVITSDREAPEQMRLLITDALGEISARVKDINLVDLLTRDMVDLVGNHLELYRRNQTAIGVDVLGMLSLEERDDRLKHHLLASKELHPALISPESEYKVLQRLMGAVLAVVLRPREAQCPLVCCISRELLTSLVMQPIMNLASPGYINELIEYVVLNAKDHDGRDGAGESSQPFDLYIPPKISDPSLGKSMAASKQQRDVSKEGETSLSALKSSGGDPLQPRSADWARVLEAATQRRTEVLAPENLENMWTKGRNYKTKHSNVKAEVMPPPAKKLSGTKSAIPVKGLRKDMVTSGPGSHVVSDDEAVVQVAHGSHVVSQLKEDNFVLLHSPKLRCRVVRPFFEKIGSKSFAVYSIAVTAAGYNNTWFVKRRYRNFERLHRHIKDIPNYTLHLPPKGSSIDDSFVHQRCIQLDRYLQDLLSIANVAEQHEVWDFLSASSKNYSFGKSTSVMKTLAVIVDDALDGILHQVKGVSDGLMRKVVGSSTLPSPPATSSLARHTWNGDNSQHSSNYNEMETSNTLSDNEEHALHGSQDKEEIVSGLQVNGWHSDNELNLKSSQARLIKRVEDTEVLISERPLSDVMSPMTGSSNPPLPRGLLDYPVGVPPEWSPPNVSVPLLNLVDKIFQLKKRGWLRRQVFWFSNQILQLFMEDAIDDWLLRQIHWLRRDDVIATGIHWIPNVLWPNGTFFLKIGSQSKMDDAPCNQSKTKTSQPSNLGSFELQLEAAGRASDIKKMIVDGAPTALVSLIGHKQYKRCARDVYYFIQSNVCVKQLAYGLLELLLISVFPELQDIVLDVHEKA